MNLGGRAWPWRSSGARVPAGSAALDTAVEVLVAAAFADALLDGEPRPGGVPQEGPRAPSCDTPDAERVASAERVAASHADTPLAQAALVVAGLHAHGLRTAGGAARGRCGGWNPPPQEPRRREPATGALSWGRALAALATSLPAVLSEDGVPRGRWSAELGGVAPTDALARLLGAVALARIAARRAGAPFPGAVDRAFAAGVHYLALRTGVAGRPDEPACERADTWRDPAFLHALAVAWGLAPHGVATRNDPRLRWFGVVARGPADEGERMETASVSAAAPRRGGRARAETGPTWDVHAFHAGGCVVAQERARPTSRVVATCGEPGLALAWERGRDTVLEGAPLTPVGGAGTSEATLGRARVDGRWLCVEGDAPVSGGVLRRSLRAQPGRWRVVDRCVAGADAREGVPVHLVWRLGAGWRLAGGLERRDGDLPGVEARATCGDEELRVQLPAALVWEIAEGGAVLAGVGRLAEGAVLASSFEIRARGREA